MPGRALPPLQGHLGVKLVSTLTEDEVRECLALTLPHGSMRSSLLHSRANISPRLRQAQRVRDRDHTTAILVRAPKGALVAWSLIKYSSFYREPTSYMFVSSRYRRRGLGSRMVAEINVRWPGARFCPWDNRSACFFENYRQLPYCYEGERFMSSRAAVTVAIPTV
jgi:GNAT superfamily N-acetyltransferase